MSRHRRAAGFLLAAALAAVVAGAVADGYGRSVARGYGELRPVVVAAGELAAGREIGVSEASTDLEVRRVPVRFAPPDVLAAPAQAIGLEPAAAIPAGSYLLASQLRPAGTSSSGRRLGAGRRPVQISVSGADALLFEGERPAGSPVDLIVTTEPGASGSGRTYVAAAGVPLLALGSPAEGVEAGGLVAATLGLTRRQALRLVAAESYARRVTIMPGG